MDKRSGAWFSGWLVTRKGSDTSGNWMHKGDPPNRGGSAPGGGHAAMGIAAGTPTEEVKEKIQARREEMKDKQKKDVTIAKGPGVPGSAPANKDRSELVDHGLLQMLSDSIHEDHWQKVSTASKDRLILGNADILSNLSGVESHKITSMMYAWARTSNDQDAVSLTTQIAASKTFGVELSDFQKESIEESNLFSGNDSTIEEKSKVLQAMYTRTQGFFADRGYKSTDKITLFRGIGSEEAGKVEEGDVVFLKQNAISSWSASDAIAEAFSHEEGGAVLVMDVPISSILSSSLTGLGTMKEAEFVIFGVPDSQARVLDVQHF